MKPNANYRATAPRTCAVLAASLLFFAISPGQAFSVAEKAQAKRIELMQYMRHIKPMVYNYPCEPFPNCYQVPEGGAQNQTGERVTLYKEIKRIYQEGMIYYFEGNYINAYNRFLDAQVRTEKLLEGLSQYYLDRSEQMMRDALERKTENDPADFNVVDMAVEYGPSSRKRRDFAIDRDAPNTGRRYDSKETHWAYNKYRIERNIEKGYQLLGMAKEARQRALTVDANLRREQKIQPEHRKARIEYYLAAIRLAQMSKVNAAFIYQLKYPFDNYALQNPHGFSEAEQFEERKVPQIEDVRMNWIDNPYVLPKSLHPVFDLRLPEKYRRDTTDAGGMIYEEELDLLVRMKYVKEKPKSFEQVKGPAPAATPGN